MNSKRRQFLVGGAAAAGAMAAMAAGASAQAAPALSIVVQFSGLIVHGRTPKSGAKFVYSKWAALMAEHGTHMPELRIPIANIDKVVGRTYTRDRVNPDLAVWSLSKVDLSIKVDGKTDGEVEGLNGLRPVKNNAPAPCPDPFAYDQYRDIAWLADFAAIFGNGQLKPGLAGPPAGFPANVVNGRVRLPDGMIECGLPSIAAFDRLMFKYVDSPYPPQFTADITRFNSRNAKSDITLELAPFVSGSTTVISLKATDGNPIPVRAENHDPLLADAALRGKIDYKNYWDHHFRPYHQFLATAPKPTIVPSVNSCDGAPDPPFYCINGAGDLP